MPWVCAECTLINLGGQDCSACGGSSVLCPQCTFMNNFDRGPTCLRCFAPLLESDTAPGKPTLLSILQQRSGRVLDPGSMPSYELNAALLSELYGKGGLIWLLKMAPFRSVHYRKFLLTLVEDIVTQAMPPASSQDCLRLAVRAAQSILNLDQCVCLWPQFLEADSLVERNELWRLLTHHRFKESDLHKLRYLASIREDGYKYPHLSTYYSGVFRQFMYTARGPWWGVMPNTPTSSSSSSSSSASSSAASSSSPPCSFLPEANELEDEGWSDVDNGEAEGDDIWADAENEDIENTELAAESTSWVEDPTPMSPQVNIHVVTNVVAREDSRGGDSGSATKKQNVNILNEAASRQASVSVSRPEQKAINSLSIPNSSSWEYFIMNGSFRPEDRTSVPQKESEEFITLMTELHEFGLYDLSRELLAECFGTGRIVLLQQTLRKMRPVHVFRVCPPHRLNLLLRYLAMMDTASDLELQIMCGHYVLYLALAGNFRGVVDLCRAIPVKPDISRLVCGFWEAFSSQAVLSFNEAASLVCQAVNTCDVNANVFLQHWLIDSHTPQRDLPGHFDSLLDAFCQEFGPEPGVGSCLHPSRFWLTFRDRQTALLYVNKIRFRFVLYFDELSLLLNEKCGKDLAKIVVLYYGGVDSSSLKVALMESE